MIPKRLTLSYIILGGLLIGLMACQTGQAHPEPTESVEASPTGGATMADTLSDSPAATTGSPTETAISIAESELPEAVPTLPFADNPDPSQCGIPQQWTGDETAWLNGIYEGALLQPLVYLYDSHLRREIVAAAPHGAAVQILLLQSNPALDYYMVKVVGANPPNEGWLPAPFLSFEPLTDETAPAVAAPTDHSLQPQLAEVSIPIEDIVTLLPRDAIPAILPAEAPEIMVTAAEANEAGLPANTRLIGVSINGESHAYPLPYLSRHEIVNTELGGRVIATTW